MKYVLSPIANEINGPIGGLTFCKHPKSPYARGNPITRVAPSGSQSDIRSAYGALVQLWRSLPARLRTSWNEAAAPQKISGFNLFITVNMPIELAGLPIYTIPTTEPTPAPENFFYCVQTGATYFAYAYLTNADPLNAIFISYRNPGENNIVAQGGKWQGSGDQTLHEGNFIANCWEYYTMDRDAPLNNNANFPDMGAVAPAGISQGVLPNGLEYNHYNGLGSYNTLAYSASPKMGNEVNWWFSCFFYRPTGFAGAQDFTFIEIDPCLKMRHLNNTTRFEFVFAAQSGTQTWYEPGIALDTLYHIALYNDWTNKLRYIWINGVCKRVFSNPQTGDRPWTRTWEFGGNSYGSPLGECYLGNISFWFSAQHWSSVWWEYNLRNMDMRSGQMPVLDGVDVARGYAYFYISSTDDLSQDTNALGQDITP